MSCVFFPKTTLWFKSLVNNRKFTCHNYNVRNNVHSERERARREKRRKRGESHMKYRFYLNSCITCCECNFSVVHWSGFSFGRFLFRKLVGKLVSATGLPRTFEIGRLARSRETRFSVVGESPCALSSSNVITVHSGRRFNVGQRRNADEKLLPSVTAI